MKVSIIVLTYNQEQFIAQAVNSALMQEVDFDYEILIGDDASTDRTAEIVLGLQAAHPGSIRVLQRDKTEAQAERKRGLGGKTNFVQAFEACHGKYIALLDGDDYWIDRNKLQKQVDFLEANPDFAICFTNVSAFHEDGSREPENLCPPDQRDVSTLEHLLLGNFIPACSVMFRRGLVEELPGWYLKLKMGDWPLYILLAPHGKIKYFNEVTAAYRMHGSGSWSLRNRSYHDVKLLKLLEQVNRHFDFRYSNIIDAARSRYYFELAEMYLQRGHPRHALIPIRRGIRSSRGRHRGLMSLWLQVKAPGFYNSLKGLRNLVRPARSTRAEIKTPRG